MRRALQVFLALFGSVAIAIALLHIVFGPSAIPGSVPVNATMDSEDRFYATFFVAMLALELVIPIAVGFMQFRVARR